MIDVSTANGVAEIRMNRPEKRNAITAAMYGAMRDAVIAAEADPAVRVIVFSGEGRSFTAGNDLNDFLKAEHSEDAPVRGFLRAISVAKKPLVAAVQGDAVGVGTTMLLHCDIVLAAPDARLKLPFVDLALVPEAASSLLLPRVLGHQRAAAMIMLNETLDAETARDFGIVYKVVPLADLMAEARAVAAKLAAKAPGSLGAIKKLLKSETSTVPTRMAEEGKIFAERLNSPETKEAIGAFFEKRPADFSKLG